MVQLYTRIILQELLEPKFCKQFFWKKSLSKRLTRLLVLKKLKERRWRSKPNLPVMTLLNVVL